MPRPRQGRFGDTIGDANTREAVVRLEQQLVDIFAGIGRLSRGQSASSGGAVLLPPAITDHGTLLGLADDDHSQYLLLAGRVGGQTITNAITINNGASNDALICIGGVTARRFAGGTNLRLDDSTSPGIVYADVKLTGIGDITISSTAIGGATFIAPKIQVSGAAGAAQCVSISVPNVVGANALVCSNLGTTTYIDKDGSIVLLRAGQVVRCSSTGSFQFTNNAGSGFVTGLSKDASDNIVIGETNTPTILEKPAGTTVGTWANTGLTVTNLVSPLATLGTPGGTGVQDVVIGITTDGGADGGLYFDDGSTDEMGTFWKIQHRTVSGGITANRTVTWPDASGTVMLTLTEYQLLGNVNSIFKTNTSGQGARFQDTTTSSKVLRFVLSGAVGASAIALANTAARTYTLPDVTGTAPIAAAQPASGSLLVGAGTTTQMSALAIGSAGKVLTVSGSAPVWATFEAFPVGAVFISVVSTNPNTLLGYGTWSAIAAGRVLVGLDSGDTAFDTVEETGGAKTVASAGTVSAITNTATPAITLTGLIPPSSDVADQTHTHPAPTFTGTATSVVQPYFVVYMWKRTA